MKALFSNDYSKFLFNTNRMNIQDKIFISCKPHYCFQ